MSLLIAILISYFFLDWPWTLVVIVAASLFELFEIGMYFRWRKVRAISGHETLIGATGKTMGEVNESGQARIRGQIWTVESDEPLERGADVRVVAMDGLKLKVERA